MTDRYKNPTVASFVKTYKIEPTVLTTAEIAEAFAAVLRETALAVQASGGLVGHIKAVVNFSPGGALRLSVVKGNPGRADDHLAADARPLTAEAALTAIVFGPSTEDLHRLLAQALTRFLPEALVEKDGKN